MKIELDYKFGQSIYLKNDDQQIEYLLNRIILEQKGRIALELLTPLGELIEVAEMHCSKEPDVLKKAGVPRDED